MYDDYFKESAVQGEQGKKNLSKEILTAQYATNMPKKANPTQVIVEV